MPAPASISSPAKAQAIVLAAGRGERMRPLTDTCPKPLLPVRGKPLIQWHLEALARGGFTDAVVNTAWLGDRLEQALGAGSGSNSSGKYGDFRLPVLHDPLLISEHSSATLRLHYSHEGHDFGAALETAGGIARALPLLDEVFWVAAGDVFAPDFAYAQTAVDQFRRSGKLAHLWLVPNPDHNPRGDFGLGAQGLALNLPKDGRAPLYTYSTIGLYRQAFFAPPLCGIPAGNPQGVKAALAPVLRAAMDMHAVSAEIYTGGWTDVGTPERLRWLNQTSP
jgi:N-acetyl-alpha-D-muramate 1-phosphate uridylyltransferase